MAKVDYKALLANISIEEVAARLGMDLRKSGGRTMTLCPFHSDKSPSLLIDSNRERGEQHFHCFACGAHGDAIDLVKETLNVDFKGAVDWLSNTFILGSTVKSSVSGRARSKKDRDPSSGLELALHMYQRGSSAEKLNTWMQTRGLNAATIRLAGFAYAESNYLSQRVRSEPDQSRKRELAGLLEDARLVRKLFPGITSNLHMQLNAGDAESARYGDFFIGERVIFPLYDQDKHLVGLGARLVSDMPGSTSPKYQFTKGFAKASVLYRAEHAFSCIRQAAKKDNKEQNLYLCEGFLDALRLESFGLNAVAVMGNSLSDQQVQLIKVLRDGLPSRDADVTVVVCFDRDEAGLRGGADACLKLLAAGLDCKFCWPTTESLTRNGVDRDQGKDPNDYLSGLSVASAIAILTESTYPATAAVLAFAFGSTADETLSDSAWRAARRSRRMRAFTRATSQLKRVVGRDATSLVERSVSAEADLVSVQAVRDWAEYLAEATVNFSPSASEEFLNNARARLNHARLLAYMGSKRGELPCDEPRWARLDIAATAFNTLLVERLASPKSEPIGSYDAVWVPRAFGGEESRLKIMPCPEDLIIQQYLLNEILTERWDHSANSDMTFSRCIPAVRYYREEHRTITTGFDVDGKGNWSELSERTLSFAYQIDMDVLEGRQPATSQGMFRPYHECWLEFMKSVSKQASEIGYVYSVRLDVKRYYDRLRKYVVRDSIQSRLQKAIESVTGDTPGFAELLGQQFSSPLAIGKTTAVLERLDEHLFGVTYRRPDTGTDEITDSLKGIPQGPVLSAWIGSIALFPVDEVANKFINRLNVDKSRVGYARYVDDIVLLADSPSTLMEIREEIDQVARSLQLTLLAKADEIPPMGSVEFSEYLNQGRALAVSGPAWEPPLTGDGESGWEFWSVNPSTDRQSALHLLHNIELYKAPCYSIIQTVRTAFQAPDLRTSELSKAARLLWYAIACEQKDAATQIGGAQAWSRYLALWHDCVQVAPWRLMPEKYSWESPILFGLEGLEHLLDTKNRDVRELTADENEHRRERIKWLASLVLEQSFESALADPNAGPKHQRESRYRLVAWKAAHAIGHPLSLTHRSDVEGARPVQSWEPFEWMHKAVSLLAKGSDSEEDPLVSFLEPFKHQANHEPSKSSAVQLFGALLPSSYKEHSNEASQKDGAEKSETTNTAIALQTLVSVAPRKEVLTYLSKRPHLFGKDATWADSSRLLLPPLPGVGIQRLFACLVETETEANDVIVRGLETIALSEANLPFPEFTGVDLQMRRHPLTLEWVKHGVEGSKGVLELLEAALPTEEYLCFHAFTEPTCQAVSADTLKAAATLYKAIAEVAQNFARDNPDLTLVPAWPYIAKSIKDDRYYIIGEGVSRDELGNRAFIRDGGRSLRTIEVPIYEADLWRVGAAVSDLIGLHDDVTKFSSSDTEVTLDATALGNPARYILRSQMRKLRGAFADSRVSKRETTIGALPASLERALRLLETFPDESAGSIQHIIHVLAIETESAAMFLSFRDPWDSVVSVTFLKELTSRVISRLPLSIAKDLATQSIEPQEIRRDLWGLLCFARRLFMYGSESSIAQEPAWRALCAGTICAGISVAVEGLMASLRSHGSFEVQPDFDFPAEWDIASVTQSALQEDSSDSSIGTLRTTINKPNGLIAQFRLLVQHLGVRLRRETTAPHRISAALFDALEKLVRKVASAEYSHEFTEERLGWPFECVCDQALELFNLDLLESTVDVIRRLDQELGLEVVLAKELSYGYNVQTRRFVDSRSGSWEVTPWMISQFPRGARHIEEHSQDGRVWKVWSEIYDRDTGRLLSVSVLGEPFASIAIEKNAETPTQITTSAMLAELSTHIKQPAVPEREVSTDDSLPSVVTSPSMDFNETTSLEDAVNQQTEQLIEAEDTAPVIEASRPSSTEVKDSSAPHESSAPKAIDPRSFRNQQSQHWRDRGESRKIGGHIRIALLQVNLGMTYAHPMKEVCPSQWPVSNDCRDRLKAELKPENLYKALSRSTTGAGTEHHWSDGVSDDTRLMSWEEHRRRRTLERVIDSCEAFGVDLLVLPEYSVRRETVDWLKEHLANKKVAVLAGTYMEFRHEPHKNNLASQLSLLWPVPKDVVRQMSLVDNHQLMGIPENTDALNRGIVLELGRKKKYRSIALNEFFRPHTDPLGPLFKPEVLIKEIQEQSGFTPTVNTVIELLSQTPLPLKHVLELVCSEVFLVSSPANYQPLAKDYITLRRRFGQSGESNEVENDLKELAKHLSMTGGDGKARRSILAIPAATSRSADYWIAGQASLLAAGITSVFCNAADSDHLVGGSCFIGRDSWKGTQKESGYLTSITPYHGWSKGIYYNDKSDALSKKDQAVVIADIDPHNMLEGKPRPQAMPVPLQLVAYLPLIEHVDKSNIELHLLKQISNDEDSEIATKKIEVTQGGNDFWSNLSKALNKSGPESFDDFWKLFPDEQAVSSRASAFWRNGAIQPSLGTRQNMAFGSPAFYDWLDVNLSLSGGQVLPAIAVPAWTKLPT